MSVAELESSLKAGLQRGKSERRVLMIAAAFPPSNSAGVHRTARFARMLPEFGWEPVVLTQTGADGEAVPKWVRGLRVERRAKRERESGTGFGGAASSSNAGFREKRRIARWEWLKDWGRNARDLLQRTPDGDAAWAASATEAACRLARECAVEAVYTSGPPHSLHLLGRRVRGKLGIPWVMDFRDPWARKPWGYKASNPWGQRALWWFESRCVRSADAVVLNTPRMAAEFRNWYAAMPAERFVAIPNGCDPELLERVRELCAESERSSGERDGVIRVLHPGSLYRQRDPRPIVDGLVLLHERGLRVALEQVGHCEAEFGLAEYARRRGMRKWVTIEPPVAHGEVLQRMADADMLLLVQPGTDLQVPGKLFEMLAYDKPIVALADAGATSDIITEYGLGAVVNGNDGGEIAQGIERAWRMRGTATLSAGLERAARDFDGRSLAGELAGVLDGIAGCTEMAGDRRFAAAASEEVSGG